MSVEYRGSTVFIVHHSSFIVWFAFAFRSQDASSARGAFRFKTRTLNGAWKIVGNRRVS
jgi:hypothetical protein